MNEQIIKIYTHFLSHFSLSISFSIRFLSFPVIAFAFDGIHKTFGAHRSMVFICFNVLYSVCHHFQPINSKNNINIMLYNFVFPTVELETIDCTNHFSFDFVIDFTKHLNIDIDNMKDNCKRLNDLPFIIRLNDKKYKPQTTIFKA